MSTRYAFSHPTIEVSLEYQFNNEIKDIDTTLKYDITYGATEWDGDHCFCHWIEWLDDINVWSENSIFDDEIDIIMESILKENKIDNLSIVGNNFNANFYPFVIEDDEITTSWECEEEYDTVPEFYIVEKEINNKIDYLENEQVLIKWFVDNNDIILEGINKKTNITDFVIKISKDNLLNTLENIVSVLNSAHEDVQYS